MKQAKHVVTGAGNFFTPIKLEVRDPLLSVCLGLGGTWAWIGSCFLCGVPSSLLVLCEVCIVIAIVVLFKTYQLTPLGMQFLFFLADRHLAKK